MPDETQVGDETVAAAGAEPTKPARKTAAKKTATKKAATKKTASKKAPAKKAAQSDEDSAPAAPAADGAPPEETTEAPAEPAKRAAKKATKKAPAKKAAAKKTAAKKAAPADAAVESPADAPAGSPVEDAPAAEPAAPAVLFQVPEQTTTRTRRTRKSAATAEPAAAPTDAAPTDAPQTDPAPVDPQAAPDEAAPDKGKPAKKTAKKAAAKKAPAKTAAKKTAKKAAAKKGAAPTATDGADEATEEPTDEALAAAAAAEEPELAPVATEKGATEQGATEQGADEASTHAEDPTDEDSDDDSDDAESGEGTSAPRRRRRRGGRRRRRSGGGSDSQGDDEDSSDEGDSAQSGRSGDSDAEDDGDGSGDDSPSEGGSSSSRRRRRRRRAGEDSGEAPDDPANTVTRVRSKRSVEDEITAVSGSTRLEAKKQRRREGREAGRRRAPIVSEAEFLARRESVDRVMVIRQRDELTQIGVLEDRVLVEHYLARESQTSLIGNVYLGRVQNVLPSMEAAFIDIGKGRNAVLYAGEVNWSALGHKDGQPRKIESVLSSGQTVLVQVTKDPIGHKGARLTSQISLAGRFLVYVPDGTTSGISRKLPDTERNRLKALLKEIVPDSAGVIVRTAAEGASEEELTRDVERLKARWEDIESKAKGSAPQLLYGEPDLTLKVVRDLFTEDFSKLVIQGDDAWETVQSYVTHVAPDLEERLERYEPGPDGRGGKADVFAEYRIDEQIAKGLDRKVWLPSGGSLIIDRTEAMTVIDVNTGKFTGSGGNLEETVTKNNLEAAEEVVRQLRLRDIGGIIVVDFIDMVLESNRDLVLRRLVECLGRDRTRHQVAEVTSLGLVQMTRKRIGTGLLEVFGENCEHCQGRGVIVHDRPVEPKRGDDESRRGGGRRGRGRGRGQDGESQSGGGQAGAAPAKAPSPKDVAAMARPDADRPEADQPGADGQDAGTPAVSPVDTGSAPSAPAPAAEPAPESASVSAAPEPAAPEPAAPEPAAGDQAVVEQAGADQAVADRAAEPTPAEVPAAPQVVTRTRRRAASRPAGEPASIEPAAPPAPQPETGQPESSQPEPVQPPAPVEPPKVVTRTRTRSARRPAGPPAEAAAPIGADPAAGEPTGALAAGGASTDHTDEPGTDTGPIEHVPIKKKGSRKR